MKNSIKMALITASIFLVTHAKAQTSNVAEENKNVSEVKSGSLSEVIIVAYPSTEKPTDMVHEFSQLDTQPTYLDGMDNFYKYIGQNLKYPSEAIKNKIEGIVFVSFIIEKNGDLSNVKVERKLGYGTDEAASSVIYGSKKWSPGLLNGQAVRTKYNIPIKFALNKK